MSILRTGFQVLANQRELERLVTGNALSARVARRFVAGESLEEALAAVRALNAQGMSASLDYLGEAVHDLRSAEAAKDVILSLLRAIHETGVNANVSIKLTQLGLDIDEERCRQNVAEIVGLASALDSFVRFDMESSAYTQRTLDLFAWTNERFPNRSGVVIQSYLRRSAADVERLIAMGARVRLCKGAYLEPPEVAFPDKRDVDRNYVKLAMALLERGNYPGIATHDESIITFVRDFTRRHGIAPARFEFQMLYGVRRDLQAELVRAGYNVRIYTPFGQEWYPYFMRRLAERPANLMFILTALARERGNGAAPRSAG